MEKALNFTYDKEGDILDVSLGRPEQAISEEISEDIFVRMDPKSKKIIGFMILNFEKRFNRTRKTEMLPIIGNFKLAQV
ncbi:MAG: hypothetical protein US31_C0006G0051 [Berkelbacteria bacterium GW2011_GWA1_36_9]|uniref:DUF2283 domain-containing protein n=1 Tax=Berkelbacteria bacterium GW2011_GWA1_36_9 TaxID=1618331 RepID=A0A0G0FWU2_9BACT|nr:MAG: hypothetical protein US31_C0006G0051 [Berkelbacteria bacterium GW2011_GWA1_36_9]